MKHYLLTWYGITDLRAALGLEPTDGPILSALKTRQFTDVIILAYTNPGKSPNDFSAEARDQWLKWRSEDLETRLQFPRNEAQKLVDTLSNTEMGHAIFRDWLKAEMESNGISCNIQIVPQVLNHLNDAQGIHDAAASAVKRALDDASEKTLTSYISPGTPVMAYTWALIARAHPHHNIAVIASSDPRKPPEKIDLPKDLLMPLVTGQQTRKPSEYDVLIHLLGRERMPIYFGMLQFKAPLHIFITTPEYVDAAHVLSRCLPANSSSKTITVHDAFKPADTRRAMDRQLGQFPPLTRIAVNLTGGTKLMFAGALASCWERGLEPFYFEVNHHNIIFIRDGSTVPFVGAKSVADFFVVNGFDVVTQGRWGDEPRRAARMNATQELWKGKKTVGQLYQTPEFRSYKVPFVKGRNPPFSWKWGTSQATFNANGNATLVLNGKAVSMPDCDDYAQYLGGAWLEEHVFFLLRELEVKGVIRDLRIGVEVDYAGKTRHRHDAPNGEFDCAFTDGRRLWIVECKAGSVKQEHIQKLENNLKTYGGIAARGILVSSFPIPQQLSKRMSSSTAIRSVQADDVTTEMLQKIIGT